MKLHQITKPFKREFLKLRTVFRVIDSVNTIYELKNEKDHSNHYNEFEHIQDLEELFQKIVYAILVYEILNNNVYLSLMDWNKF